MEFSIKKQALDKETEYGAIIVGVFEGSKRGEIRLSPIAEEINTLSQGAILSAAKAGDLSGKVGSTLLLHRLPTVPAERVLVLGLGQEKSFGEKAFRRALQRAFGALHKTGARDALLTLTAIPIATQDIGWRIRQAVLAADESIYQFSAFKSEAAPPIVLEHLCFAVEGGSDMGVAKEALLAGEAIAEGVRWAKDLGNTPGNVCTPSYLAAEAQKMAKAMKMKCEVLSREEMESLGMFSLLSVTRGSHQPPQFMVLRYSGLTKKASKKERRPIVLVGKGVTFDTGGISLKPGEGMDEMKYDMCGAATVLGTMKAAARMALPLEIIALLPCVENMPGGNATRPGDIVRSMSQKTIEILNTDAEGRLILCDALTYAERFNPACVVDVATLTGACVIALGHVATGLFSNNEALGTDLLEAARVSQDLAWQMPLWDEYREALKSNFADLANVGGRPAGSVTAACFLSYFTEKFEWAHLDIAGTAWVSGRDKGATGRPVPLLTHFLMARAGRLA